MYVAFRDFIINLADFLWGGTWGGETILPAGPVVVILLGTGLYFMIRLGFRPLKRFVPAIRSVWAGRKSDDSENAITPWQALSTALSGQVGTGNLAGVATAMTLGGPGAIFWMWVTAFFGMALAFAESSLAVKYREVDSHGRISGGPMYYIKNGLSSNWAILAVLFCIGTLLSASVTGGMTQSNSMTQTFVESLRDVGIGTRSTVTICLEAECWSSQQIEFWKWIIGALIAGLTFAVIIGGIKSIGKVAGRLVPFMAALYVVAALLVLLLNITSVPAAFWTIIASALGIDQAVGGVVGYTVLMAVRFGVDRGLFSNEGGQGSAPIAHAATQYKNPTAQGEIAMVGVFIDTLVICTMTALVILSVPGDFKRNPALVAYKACESAGHVANSEDLYPKVDAADRVQIIKDNGEVAVEVLNSCRARDSQLVDDRAIEAASDPTVIEKVDRAWKSDLQASAVTTAAFNAAIPFSGWLVTICLALFAFTTIIGWSYYAEKAITFLAGEWMTEPIRYIWVGIIFIGALAEVHFVWMFGGLANAFMAVPNLIAIVALSSVVMAMHRKNGDPDTENGESVIIQR